MTIWSMPRQHQSICRFSSISSFPCVKVRNNCCRHQRNPEVNPPRARKSLSQKSPSLKVLFIFSSAIQSSYLRSDAPTPVTTFVSVIDEAPTATATTSTADTVEVFSSSCLFDVHLNIITRLLSSILPWSHQRLLLHLGKILSHKTLPSMFVLP